MIFPIVKILTASAVNIKTAVFNFKLPTISWKLVESGAEFRQNLRSHRRKPPSKVIGYFMAKSHTKTTPSLKATPPRLILKRC